MVASAIRARSHTGRIAKRLVVSEWHTSATPTMNDPASENSVTWLAVTPRPYRLAATGCNARLNRGLRSVSMVAVVHGAGGLPISLGADIIARRTGGLGRLAIKQYALAFDAPRIARKRPVV